MGGFGPCPGVSRHDGVSYGINALLFPATGGAHALVQQLEPMFRAHGWGSWQSGTGVLNSLNAQPYVVSKHSGYTLWLQVQQAGDGDESALLLLGGPCVVVGVAEARALVSATQDGNSDEIDISPGSPHRAPTSALRTPKS